MALLGLAFLNVAIKLYTMRFREAAVWVAIAFGTIGVVMLAHFVSVVMAPGEPREKVIWFVFDPLLGFFFVAAALNFVRILRKRRLAAEEFIRDDVRAYDAAWELELDQAGADVAAVCALADNCAAEPLEASQAKYTAEVRHRISSHSRSDEKPRQRSSDLAVLLRQANHLNSHFAAVASSWAAGGVMQACPVKRRARAIEKLHRCYRGDAGMITDLVRASISCPNPRAVADVLRAVERDPRVAVLQCKNRFDAAYDSRLTAGYRNVALLLVVVDARTLEDGCAEHIAELQIDLDSIAALKSDGGHRRYVEWRNMRAT
jgi:hypothetical protein